MRFLTCVCVSLCLLGSSSVWAGWDDGVAAFQSKDYEQAIGWFEDYLGQIESFGQEVTSDHASAYFMIGASHYRLKNYTEAIESLKRSNELKGGDQNTLLTLGQAYYRSGDFGNAARTLAPYASNPVVAKMVANSYEQSGNKEMSLAGWEKASKLNPSDAASQFNYGMQALANDYTDDAVVALAKAVSLDSGDSAKHRVYTTALIRKARETSDASGKQAVYGKAVTAAKQLVQVENSFDNLLLLGETQLGAKQYGGAIESFTEAIGKNSNDWLAYYYLGQAYTVEGDFTAALKPLEIAQGVAGADQKKIWSQLGFVYEKQKRYPDAKEAYTKAGDSAGLNRVAENESIAEENRAIEEQNAQIEELERQKRELEREMRQLPGASGPPN